METRKENKMSEEKNKEVSEVVEEEIEISESELIETLTLDNEKLKNEYFKARADAQNYKKRMQRELDSLMKYRIQSFAMEVLPVLDNLERALESESEDTSFKQGVQMIYDQLVSALANEGVKEIEALGQEFDANVHQAMSQEKQEDVESGIIIEVYQKGYVLKDRVLRAAMVKVSE
ncbi:MAG: nucleotide exchange factor GrpE [Erysipelothrix sp.]|nr:nucleotide exchange factor GrpE [Erysipelothrix sp.]